MNITRFFVILISLVWIVSADGCSNQSEQTDDYNYTGGTFVPVGGGRTGKDQEDKSGRVKLPGSAKDMDLKLSMQGIYYKPGVPYSFAAQSDIPIKLDTNLKSSDNPKYKWVACQLKDTDCTPSESDAQAFLTTASSANPSIKSSNTGTWKLNLEVTASGYETTNLRIIVNLFSPERFVYKGGRNSESITMGDYGNDIDLFMVKRKDLSDMTKGSGLWTIILEDDLTKNKYCFSGTVALSKLISTADYIDIGLSGYGKSNVNLQIQCSKENPWEYSLWKQLKNPTITFYAGSIKEKFKLSSLSSDEIYSWRDLDTIRYDLAADYKLKRDIYIPDSSATQAPSGYEFRPIGSSNEKFTGSLKGGGYSINNFYISKDNDDYVGLFRYIMRGNLREPAISDLTISMREDPDDSLNLQGRNYVGVIAAYLKNSMISKVLVEGARVGSDHDYVGIISGLAEDSIIKDSHAYSKIKSRGNNVGGLVGSLEGSKSVIEDSHSEVSIEAIAGKNIGGLAGSNSGIIKNSYSLGTISGKAENVGGLVGINKVGDSSKITASFAYMDIECDKVCGGFLGNSEAKSNVDSCYAAGFLTAKSTAGGFVGFLSGAIKKSYTTSLVEAGNPAGGFAGKMANTAILNANYFSSSTGLSLYVGSTGETVSGVTKILGAPKYMEDLSSFYDSQNEYWVWIGRAVWPSLKSVDSSRQPRIEYPLVDIELDIDGYKVNSDKVLIPYDLITPTRSSYATAASSINYDKLEYKWTICDSKKICSSVRQQGGILEDTKDQYRKKFSRNLTPESGNWEVTVTLSSDGIELSKDTVIVASENAKPIDIWEDLEAIGNDLEGSYYLNKDITFPNYTTEDKLSNGFKPIGDGSMADGSGCFKGRLNGRGYTISNIPLYTAGGDNIGLFSCIKGSVTSDQDWPTISNLRLRLVDITPGQPSTSNYVGGLAGKIENGLISRVDLTGVVKGDSHVGAIAGEVQRSYILDSSFFSDSGSAGSISANHTVGGIAGRLYETVVKRSYSGSLVSNIKLQIQIKTKEGTAGGIAGIAEQSELNYVYSLASISTDDISAIQPTPTAIKIGGIAGAADNVNDKTKFDHTYFAGSITVTGSSLKPGGLVGNIIIRDANGDLTIYQNAAANIDNSYYLKSASVDRAISTIAGDYQTALGLRTQPPTLSQSDFINLGKFVKIGADGYPNSEDGIWVWHDDRWPSLYLGNR